MCDLSEVVLERGMQQGIEKKLIDLVCKKTSQCTNHRLINAIKGLYYMYSSFFACFSE